MKLNLNILTIILIVSILYSCKNRNNKKTEDLIEKTDSTENIYFKDNCTIGIRKNNSMEVFFPFELRNFDSKKLRKYFNENVIIDSIEKEDQPGYKYFMYDFHDSLSSIDFFVKSFDTTSNRFYIETGVVRSNIVQFKNGIHIEMTKKDFLKAMNITNMDCDSISVREDSYSYEYHFVFRNNQLKKIIFYNTF